MKILRHIATVSALLLFLYGMAQLAQPSSPPETEETMERLMPPAPYPQHFERDLQACREICIRLHPAEDLPTLDLWQSYPSAPPIGSPQAHKGGTLRLSSPGPFPANFLAFGSPSPQFFHYNLFERIDIPLLREHPATGQILPGLAEKWSMQGNILYLRLHPQARYSNGRPLRARDFALGLLLRLRAGDKSAVGHIRELHVYGDEFLAVVLPRATYGAELLVSGLLKPAEPGFYADFGGNYAEVYARRIPPTTGAYTLSEVQWGRLLVLRKVPGWWAADLPGFRHTHNPDRIEHHFLNDEAQTWELFSAGKIDLLQTRNVLAWESRAVEAEQSAGGKIHLRTLRLTRPVPPYGIALNAEALPDIELRRGILQALDMDKVTLQLFRGYAERMPQFAAGYHNMHEPDKPVHYSPEAARSAFARAGYSRTGGDGILLRENGTRLRVRLSYTPSDKLNQLVSILVQSAAACGLELVPEPLPWQNISRRLREGRHELIFWASMPGFPHPDYRHWFHSEAQEAESPFRLRNKEMDAAIQAMENATNRGEWATACSRAEALIRQQAVWLPGWMENHANVAYRNHVHIPEDYAGPYDVAESHQLWISPEEP